MRILTLNACIIVINYAGNTHCQICHFCVVSYLRKTLKGHETIFGRDTQCVNGKDLNFCKGVD